MKKKGVLIGIGCALLAVLLVGGIWWNLPTTFLSDVSPTDVARIEVFNGTNGCRFTIDNAEDITYIVHKIRDVKMQREEWEAVDGFVYSLSFYAADGSKITHFILNASDSIRDGDIAYKCQYETYEDPLCFYYIRDLEEAQRNPETQ